LHLGDDKLARLESVERLLTADTVKVLDIAVTRYVRVSEPGRTAPSELELNQ
jgi:hypothetical protein